MMCPQKEKSRSPQCGIVKLQKPQKRRKDAAAHEQVNTRSISAASGSEKATAYKRRMYAQVCPSELSPTAAYQS